MEKKGRDSLQTELQQVQKSQEIVSKMNMLRLKGIKCDM